MLRGFLKIYWQPHQEFDHYSKSFLIAPEFNRGFFNAVLNN